MRPSSSVALLLPVLAPAILLGGCAAGPRTHPLFDGRSGEPLEWAALMDRVEAADVIFLGEQHDDAAGHAVQLALVEDASDLPAGLAAVSLEMLETHDQPAVDDYLVGRIEREAFIEATESESWRGWRDFYQPVVDAARAADAAVIAANAPREYARAARTEGYDHLRSLSATERDRFAMPVTIDDADDYRRRFFAVMGVHEHAAATTTPATTESDAGGDHAHGHGESMSRPDIMNFFRAQMVWDATMADRIQRFLASRPGERGRVIHLVGDFHIAHEGGTVLELKARSPQARILTISIVPSDAQDLADDDRGRADVVIYTR